MDPRLSRAMGGFRSMRSERPMFACRLDMQQHMQHLRQNCLELRTRRLVTPWAGGRDGFLAGHLLRRRGGGGGGHAPMRLCRCSPHGKWVRCGCASLRLALSLLRRSAATVQIVSVGTAWGHTLLRTGPYRVSSGRGGGNGLNKGPAGVFGTSRATPAATGQAPLCVAGNGGDGLPPVAGVLHAQPAGSASPV